MGALTKKEWLASLQKMIDEFDWEGEGQEPVAIGWYIEGYGAVLGAVRPNLRYEEWRPFYAIRTPRQRKPLSNQKIIEMYNEPRSDAEMIEFARAIEAAHGIKE